MKKDTNRLHSSRWLLALPLLWLACLTARGVEYELVCADGTPHAFIQGKPAAQLAQELTACQEIQAAIERISGTHLDRTFFPGPFWRNYGFGPDWVEIAPVILEEARDRLPAETVRKLDASRHADAFAIVTTEEADGKHLYIAGKNPSGVLYGAYTFIEDYLGVRFFHAGPGGEHWPRHQRIVVPEIDDFREPWCDERNISAWAGSVSPIALADYQKWLGRRKCVWWINYSYKNLDRQTLDGYSLCNHGIEGGGHGIFEQAVPKKLFETHPEYFPWQNGERVCAERSQRCLANPDVQRMIEDFIVSYTSYSDGVFNIMFHDSIDGWCQCPDCRAMGSDTQGNFSIPVMAHRFCSQLAERVLARNPEANLAYWMYSQYRPFPDIPGFRLDPRLLGTFCTHQRCYAHPFRTSECNRAFRELFQQWKQLGTRLGIFEYYCISRVRYTPLEYVLGDDMKYFRDNGVTQWIEDCTQAPEGCYPLYNWQFYYVATKLMWDADLDVEQLMDETYSIYYGQAAEPMKKYHTLRRKLWDEAQGHAYASYFVRYAEILVEEEPRRQLFALLDEAQAPAGADELLLTRIGNDRQFLTDLWVAAADGVRQAKGQGGHDRMPVARCASPVAVDGRLDDEPWSRAVPVSDFLQMGDKTAPPEETSVRVMYDRDAFFFGVEAKVEHGWGKLLAEQTVRDGEVYADDSIEFFVYAPNGEYYQVVVNTLGTIYDARGFDKTFDCQATAAVQVDEDRYTIELRFPVAPMGVPEIEPGAAWRLHVSRNCMNLQPPQTAVGISLDGVSPHDIGNYRYAEMEQ